MNSGNPSALAVSDARQGLTLASEMESAREYADASLSANTRRAYRSAWRRFEAWTQKHGFDAKPAQPAVVALYLSARAQEGRRVSSIQTDMSAIAKAHEVERITNPCASFEVTSIAKGIRHTIGIAPIHQKQPLLVPALRSIIASLPGGLIGMRDRALLLLGFSGAFRRSELVGVHVEQLTFDADGLRVRLLRSKTDQEGGGRDVGIPFAKDKHMCPVRAARDWMDAAAISKGPLFRGVRRSGRVGESALTGKSVAELVKKHIQGLGLDPRTFAGHSLRSGFATAAAKAGKSERSIAAQTGHKSMEVLRRYIRAANLFEDNAAKGLL